jgi:hypothetical protein
MSDPLARCLPWLEIAKETLAAARYLLVRQQVRRRVQDREVLESIRRGRILAGQTCLLHGRPQDIGGLQQDSPLWCGCVWEGPVVIWRLDGSRQRVCAVRRREPGTDRWRLVRWADPGGPPGDELLEEIRAGLLMPDPAAPRGALW